jgi:hypothetical protein
LGLCTTCNILEDEYHFFLNDVDTFLENKNITGLQTISDEIENGRKSNRDLKEIKPIFKITMLDYFPHMSFIRRGQDLITIEQEVHIFIPMISNCL